MFVLQKVGNKSLYMFTGLWRRDKVGSSTDRKLTTVYVSEAAIEFMNCDS